MTIHVDKDFTGNSRCKHLPYTAFQLNKLKMRKFRIDLLLCKKEEIKIFIAETNFQNTIISHDSK